MANLFSVAGTFLREVEDHGPHNLGRLAHFCRLKVYIYVIVHSFVSNKFCIKQELNCCRETDAVIGYATMQWHTWVQGYNLHCESKKTFHYNIVHNFGKC